MIRTQIQLSEEEMESVLPMPWTSTWSASRAPRPMGVPATAKE